MSDIHIRAVLLTVIGILCAGAAVGLKFAGAANAPSVMLFLSVVANVAAVWILLFAESTDA